MSSEEQYLRKEIVRLDAENEELRNRMQMADEYNRLLYQENKMLKYQIRIMESAE